MTKLKSLFLLIAICSSFAFSSMNNFTPKESNFWVGMTYLYADAGGSNEGAAIIGVAGVLDTALMEVLAVSMWGGPVGIGAGIAVGL